jgi:outer membrane protein OmpA-like peptidoglycan-associated protein
MRLLAPLLMSFAFAMPCIALAEDVEGSKDHPMFSRMPGYDISNYDPQDFASFDFNLDPPKPVEGRYWHIEYSVREGAKKVGPLQIARNYTNPLVTRGGKKLREDVNTGGGVTVAQLASGGKNLWLQVDINNGGEMFTLTIVEEGAMEQLVEFTAAELASALKTQGSVALHNVLFDTGKATLQAKSGSALAPLRELLTQDPALKLEIQGHTDNAGPPAANLKLSQERAAAVKAYVVQNFGIDAKRLTTAGYGDTRPTADNRTEAGRAQNRRVELVKK